MGCHAEELALEFDECRRLAQPILEGSLDQGPNELVQMLDSQLEAMSGEANSELWTENAMHTSVEWERVRHLASELIVAMGWSASPPPVERGATYVGSDA